jgi:serine/threonine protein kinase
MYLLGTGISSTHNIVTPYYIYFVPDNKNQTMNFSIQPYIKNSLPLYKWLRSYAHKQTPIEFYIKMCISISKSILHMHSYDIVHGDIKPDNILIDINTKETYIIDFGLSGIHGISYGTGGTKPFCCPETKNINDHTYSYYWTKNNKYYDLWSIAFIFASIIIFKNVYNNYSEYPINYFDKNKYITLLYLYRIPIKYKDIFILFLSKKTNIDLSNFINILEKTLK